MAASAVSRIPSGPGRTPPERTRAGPGRYGHRLPRAGGNERGTREYVQPSMLAYAGAWVRELEKGIVNAEGAEVHDPPFVMLARSWPDYDVLREDARFQAIVERLHFPANA